VLLAKRSAKQDDKQEILDKMQECADRIDRRKGELEGIMSKKAGIAQEFNGLVPDTDPFREALAKIFNRCCWD
jgi:cilia- and flagella-associated protein 44